MARQFMKNIKHSSVVKIMKQKGYKESLVRRAGRILSAALDNTDIR